MDTSTNYDYVPKPKKRSFITWIVFSLTTVCLAVAITGALAYANIPSINNINDCFITSMYKVNLCPKSSSYIRYSQLPKHLVAALVASEDATFFFHSGFDWDGIRDGLEKSLDAGRWVRGGSTLTQQLAKNLYLSKDRSLIRKFKEFFIAQEIEKKLTKPQIIEKYFNVVEFGKNIYGVNAAANHYFRKSAGNLTPAESAYLISLLPSPVRYSATFNRQKDLSAFNKKRVVSILKILHLQGKISDDEFEHEKSRAMNGLWYTSTPNPSDIAPNLDVEDSEQEEESEESPALEDEYE